MDRPKRPERSPGDGNELGGAQERLLERLEELKASQAELAEATARSEATLAAAVDGIITIDAAGTIEAANSAACSLFGYAESELIGENVKLLMPPPYRDEHDGYLQAYRDSGIKRIIGMGREVVGLRKDETTFPMELSVGEATAGDRKLFAGVIRDITDRKAVEQDLRDSLAQMSSILETAVDGIVAIDEAGIITSFNRAAERIFGYRAQEVIGQNVRMLMPPPYAEEHDGYLRNFRRTGRKKIIGIGREVTGLRKDGTTFPMDLSVSEAHGTAQRVFTGIVRDLSDAKRAEKDLFDSRERFDALGQNAYDLVSETDARGIVTYLGPNHQTLFGIPVEERVGRNSYDFIHPEDRQTQIEGVLEGAVDPSELPPYRYQNSTGEWRWLESAPTRYTNAAGELRIISVTRDVTNRIEAVETLRRTESRAHEAEKLASISTLTAGLAHDIGTPMSVITGYADLIGKTASDEQLRKRARIIGEQTQRVTDLIQTLLNVSRPHEPNRIALQPRRTIEHALQFFQEKLKRRRIEVEKQFDEVPDVLADPDQLEQVFLNLIVNAADAMPSGGTLRVQLTSPDSSAVEVRIRDTGTGIAPEDLSRVFEPFFTTKERGKGNGLGLLVSKGIITEHEGEIDVESTLGEGTEIRISFPAAGTRDSA